MKVFVIGLNGTGLMPCKPQKARKLLKDGKAVVYQKMPFTIKLLYKTGSTTQPVTVGIDTGSQHIGVAVVSENRTLYVAEIELRSSMEKRQLLETRKTYRRGRRYRNTRHRKPKFRTRTKRVYVETPVKRKSTGHMTHWKKVTIEFQSLRPEGWLPPSIQSKVDHHIRWIERFMEALPEHTKLRIEAARFDMARIKDPSIHGEMYQRGSKYDFENTKAYVFDRDGYRCIIFHDRLGSIRKDGSTVKGKVHHILYRSKGATDNPDYLATVCDYCHTPENHALGGKLYALMIKAEPMKRGLRDTTMMNIVRKRLYKAFPEAEFTYGNITKADREAMLLPKSHANDAVAIAVRGQRVELIDTVMYFKQVRKKKRSLHEATPRKGRKEPNRIAKRNCKNTKSVGNFHLYDTVQFEEQTGWITGFPGKSAYIQDRNENYITKAGKGYKQVNLSELTLIRHNNNWISYAG